MTFIVLGQSCHNTINMIWTPSVIFLQGEWWRDRGTASSLLDDRVRRSKGSIEVARIRLSSCVQHRKKCNCKCKRKCECRSYHGPTRSRTLQRGCSRVHVYLCSRTVLRLNREVEWIVQSGDSWVKKSLSRWQNVVERWKRREENCLKLENIDPKAHDRDLF